MARPRTLLAGRTQGNGAPEAAGKSGKGQDRAHLLNELRIAALLGHLCALGRSRSGGRLEALRVGLPMPTPGVHLSALQLPGYEIAQSPLDVLILCPHDSVERERKRMLRPVRYAVRTCRDPEVGARL